MSIIVDIYSFTTHARTYDIYFWRDACVSKLRFRETRRSPSLLPSGEVSFCLASDKDFFSRHLVSSRDKIDEMLETKRDETRGRTGNANRGRPRWQRVRRQRVGRRLEKPSWFPYLAIGDVDAEVNVSEWARADLPHQPVLATHDKLILCYWYRQRRHVTTLLRMPSLSPPLCLALPFTRGPLHDTM